MLVKRIPVSLPVTLWSERAIRKSIKMAISDWKRWERAASQS